MPLPTNRRDFVKTAALSSAAALLASASQAAPGGNLTPGSSGAGKPAGDLTPGTPLAPPQAELPKLPLLEPAARKLGWAIVGLGELALEEILPGFKHAHISHPVALVSGHPEKAAKVAATYEIAPTAIYNYENFDKIADDPSIDVVYIVLPNSMHAEYTIRALKAGKHVLCEKPMAASVEECEAMIAAAKKADRKLMIAYRLALEPKTQAAVKLLREKTFGEAKTFTSSNCQKTEAPNIRLSKKLAGGPLGDIGIYSINTARQLLGEDPIEVTAQQYQPKDNPNFREVPESVVFTMKFPSGVIASCDCSFNSTESRRWRAHCEKGYVEMDPAFSYKGLRLHTKDGETKESNTRTSELQLPDADQFALEMDHFSECIKQDKEPRAPGQMGLVDMRIIAALQEAIRTGKTVKVEG